MMKQTVGKIATDLLLKTPETTDPIELQREIQKDYIDNLKWAVQHMQKKVDCSHLVGNDRGHEFCSTRTAHLDDFYVVVITKKEKLLENVLRNYFLQTIDCPTPDYNQSVFRYDSKKEELEYLWTVPDKETCDMFQQNAIHIVPEERQLLDMVLKFRNGTLLQQARRLNGENLQTGIILEGK